MRHTFVQLGDETHSRTCEDGRVKHREPTRRRLRAVHVFACLLALAVAWAADGPSTEGAPAVRSVASSDDGAHLQATDDAGATRTLLSLSDWRAWAEPRWDRLFAEPVELAGRTLGPDDVSWLGPAQVAPDGRTVVFVASAYAVLTNVSFVGTVDAVDGTIRMVADPKIGWVEDPVLSSDGRFVAYGLGTARSGGEGVAVDDLHAYRERVRLDGEALLAARAVDLGEAEPAPAAPDADRPFLPQIHDVRWDGLERLRFRSDDPAVPERSVDGPTAPGIAWSLDLAGLRDGPWDRIGGARLAPPPLPRSEPEPAP